LVKQKIVGRRRRREREGGEVGREKAMFVDGSLFFSQR
jgi:hypothetical protein